MIVKRFCWNEFPSLSILFWCNSKNLIEPLTLKVYIIQNSQSTDRTRKLSFLCLNIVYHLVVYNLLWGQNCYVFKRKLKFRILIIYEIIFENFQKEYLFKKFNILSFVTTNRFFLSKRNLLIGQINHIGLFLSNIDGGGPLVLR